MRKPFVSLIANDRYQIGCTGQTVYVLDATGNELAKFKDMTYAYYSTLHPNGEIAAVYSNNGIMAIYSLSERRLIKKFRVSAVNDTQTGRIPCFSLDGKYLYHIEGKKGDVINSRLSVYSTADYQPVLRLFEKEQKIVLNCMEFDRDTGSCFLLGFFREENRNDYFVAQLIELSLQNVKLLDFATHQFYESAIYIKQTGFTQEAFKWSEFSFMPKVRAVLEQTLDHPVDLGRFDQVYTLNDLRQMDISLARVWRETTP